MTCWFWCERCGEDVEAREHAKLLSDRTSYARASRRSLIAA